MKLKQKILSYISIFAFFAMGLVPLRAVAMVNDPAPVAIQQDTIATSQVSIAVVNELPVPSIAIAPITLCGAPLSSVNLVQDSALFNLNQSSTCYGLELGGIKQQQIASVGLLKESPQVAVRAAPSIQPEHVSHTAPVPDFAQALPITSTAFPVAVVLRVILIVTERSKNHPTRKSMFAILQFQILRC